MAQKDPSKTEAATPKQVNRARKKGNVDKSQEVTKTVTIVGGVVALVFWLGYVGQDLMRLFRYFLSTAILEFEPTETSVTNMFLWLSVELARMILPVIMFIGVVAYIILRVQVGSLWTTEVFTPKMERFNPMNGIKRMFLSLDTFVRLGKSLLQALCIGYAPWLVIKAETPKFASLYYVDPGTLAKYLLDIGYKMVLYALVPMVILAVIDYFYSHWQYGENLKMTKAEVKDERRQMEGDPAVKAKQRQKMMQMAARRMMQDIPKADVVITNPTHIAVALRYNTMEAPAPVVLAKGAGKIAEKIREVAKEHKIPIRENKPLARALYKEVEIGDMIPEDLYQAVAAVLAQLWKMKPRSNPVQTINPPKK